MSASTGTRRAQPIQYMSKADVAEYIGLKSGASLAKYKLPQEDARVGKYRGWKKETIVAWHANRPGPGNWGART
ncbi:hypothetical protein [Mycobacteroides abscessus]|uniref:hypothetical protein n=1 Tax=Mycobacteroides abscessus TaxID=36809 RepID=UPI0009A595CD|nr:hypothetical protein [Mycobacteroides abscessus]SKT21701.1 putative transcriptional regulator [Mycobacteroides abscessus subsp. bolletii]